MKKILPALFILFGFGTSQAQCDSALATGLTLQCSGGTANRSAVAYHPVFHVYYSADAGSPSYPFETFSSTGALDTTITANIDWRGLWWNPGRNSIEGNDISSTGIDSLLINPTNGFGKTGVSTSFTYAQSMSQSCGTYDADSNEVVFYNSGNIYRFSRATGALKYTTPVTGVSTANLNPEFIGYTGNLGTEYLVYDYSAQAIYYLNRSGVYVKTAHLPASAVSNSGFRTSYCNNMFWLFDGGNKIWRAYQLSRSTTASVTRSACDSLVSPSGHVTWRNTGTYLDTIPNHFGCDSIITVHLTINSSPVITITGRDTINAGTTDTLKATGGVGYSWSNGSTTDTTMVRPTGTTTYTVTVVNGNGCSATATFKVVVRPATGIAELRNTDYVALYPNPAGSVLNLEFKSDVPSKGRIEVFDATGKNVMETEQSQVNGKTLRLDVSGLGEGMYFLKLVTDNHTQVIKFIKQ